MASTFVTRRQVAGVPEIEASEITALIDQYEVLRRQAHEARNIHGVDLLDLVISDLQGLVSTTD